MEYLRTYINKQLHETIQEFSKVLLKFWGDYHVCLWRLNKVFTSFNGNEIKVFIFGIPSILLFLNKTFKMIDQLKFINNGLWAWYNIIPFFNLVMYENDDHFKESISKFELDLKVFYAAGAKTFSQKKTLVIWKILTLMFYVFIWFNMQNNVGPLQIRLGNVFDAGI